MGANLNVNPPGEVGRLRFEVNQPDFQVAGVDQGGQAAPATFRLKYIVVLDSAGNAIGTLDVTHAQRMLLASRIAEAVRARPGDFNPMQQAMLTFDLKGGEGMGGTSYTFKGAHTVAVGGGGARVPLPLNSGAEKALLEAFQSVYNNLSLEASRAARGGRAIPPRPHANPFPLPGQPRRQNNVGGGGRPPGQPAEQQPPVNRRRRNSTPS